MLNFFKNTGLGVLVQACNPRTGEAEAEEFWGQDQPGLYRETLSPQKTKNKLGASGSHLWS
jgi:hypothetical protein